MAVLKGSNKMFNSLPKYAHVMTAIICQHPNDVLLVFAQTSLKTKKTLTTLYKSLPII